jgi:hypothetical protein
MIDLYVDIFFFFLLPFFLVWRTVLALSGSGEKLACGVTPKFLIPLLRSRPQVPLLLLRNLFLNFYLPHLINC